MKLLASKNDLPTAVNIRVSQTIDIVVKVEDFVLLLAERQHYYNQEQSYSSPKRWTGVLHRVIEFDFLSAFKEERRFNA